MRSTGPVSSVALRADDEAGDHRDGDDQEDEEPGETGGHGPPAW